MELQCQNLCVFLCFSMSLTFCLIVWISFILVEAEGAWGTRLPNGSWTGMVGMCERGVSIHWDITIYKLTFWTEYFLCFFGSRPFTKSTNWLPLVPSHSSNFLYIILPSLSYNRIPMCETLLPTVTFLLRWDYVTEATDSNPYSD